MIEQFRRASETWLAKGLFFFMAVAFVIMWGGGDLAHNIGTHGKTVATVGNRKITSTEFSDAFNHQVRELQVRLNQLIDENKARELGLFEFVRERLIQETLLGLEAENLGIYVSDNYISEQIKKDKVFQENGKFSHDRFKMLIAKIDYNEKTYIDFLRRELTRERLIDALTSGLTIPKAMVVPLYQWQNEQRQINTVAIDSQSIKINEKPSTETLQSFFDTHRDEFKAPEYRDFSVITFSTDALKKKMVVSNSDIDNEYQLQKKDFPNKKLADVRAQLIEDIKNTRLNTELQSLITEIEDAVGSGSSLTEIANKYSLTLKDVAMVDSTGATDPFNIDHASANKKADIPKKIYALVLKNAFSIDANSIGSVIEAGQGEYFITAVTSVHPASERTFDQVKSKLNEYWIRSEQIKRAQNQVKIIINEIRNGGLFNAVVGKFDLKTISARITRSAVVAPSVLNLNAQALARLYKAPKGEPVSFLGEQTDKGVKIIIAVVKSIERSKDNMPTDDLLNAAVVLKQAYINDIINEYLMMLRNKYPVEINNQYFKKIEKI